MLTIYQLNRVHFDKYGNEIKCQVVKYFTAERLDVALRTLNLRFAGDYEEHKDILPDHTNCGASTLLVRKEDEKSILGLWEEQERAYFRVEEVNVEDEPIETF